MMGYSREELVNMHISEVDAIESHEDVSKRAEEIVQRGALRFETRHRHKNGSIINIEVCSNYSPAHGGIFFSTFRDITEHKHAREIINTRLRLMEFSVNHSMDELLRKTLDEAENLTGSCVGFYHFLDSDQEMLTLQAWSTRTATNFCKAEGSGRHYHLSQAGVWVDCVRERRPVVHNDYASLPHRKGMPEGHATVVRELVVPVFRNGNIVAILGVGNKPTDYDQRDVDLVTLLADLTYGVRYSIRYERHSDNDSPVLSAMPWRFIISGPPGGQIHDEQLGFGNPYLSRIDNRCSLRVTERHRRGLQP
jgi:putative methionine-R-sulfoxide reductase with GAF domain